MPLEIARKQLHFHSPQRPHEIQAWLERSLRSVLNPIPSEARATCQTAFSWAGFLFQIRLVYEAAYTTVDAYTFHMICEVNSPAKDRPTLQRTADSWFSVWTREWKPAPTQINATPSLDLYSTRAAEWLQVHASLQDSLQLQSRILEAMRQGATFHTAHKEGGTRIHFVDNRWFRSDYGESNAYEIFHTPEAFLAFLRQFYDFETSRTLWPNKAPDPTAWCLIYRQLHPAPTS